MMVEAVSWPVATIAGGTPLKRSRDDQRERRRTARRRSARTSPRPGRRGRRRCRGRSSPPCRRCRAARRPPCSSDSFSSLVTALAMRIVQNGVVALSTEARPAPSCGLAGEDQRERDDVVEERQQEEAAGHAAGPARKDGPRASEIEVQRRRRRWRRATAPASAAWISATAMRAKKNEPPQIAPSSSSMPQSAADIERCARSAG